MATTRISQLPAVTEATADDIFIINDGDSTTSKISFADLEGSITPPDLSTLGEVDTTTVAPLDGDVLTWDSSSSEWTPGPSGVARTNTMHYLYSSDLDPATIVAGQAKFNDPDPSLITELYFSDSDVQGIAAKSYLQKALIPPTTRVWIQEATNPNNHIVADINAVYDYVGYFAFTVTVVSFNGVIPNDAGLAYAVIPDGIAKAAVDSPALTGTPTAPTAPSGTNSTQIATTEYTDFAVSNAIGIITQDDVGLGNVDNTADTAKPVSVAQQTALDLKADITYVDSADSTLSGRIDTLELDPTTQAAVDLKADITYVDSADALLAPLDSAALTGTPTAPTAVVDTNDTQLATTAYVVNQLAEELGGFSINSDIWVYDDATVLPTPDAGTFRADASLEVATELRISKIANSGIDYDAALSVMLDSTKVLYVRDQKNGDRLVAYDIETATDSGTYFTISVVVSATHGNDITNNRKCSVGIIARGVEKENFVIGVKDVNVPSSSTDTGIAGEIRYGSTYVYVCTATNTWKRLTLETW